MSTSSYPSVRAQFTGRDCRRLARELKVIHDAAFYRRVQAVWLFAEGYAMDQICTLTQSTRRAIYLWINRYLRARCIDDLQEQPRSGRPRSGRPRSGRPREAQAVSREEILLALEQDPISCGYNSTVWTVPLLCHYLSQKLECHFSVTTLRRRMKEIGLRWKRPRFVFSEKDPHRAQKKGVSFDA